MLKMYQVVLLDRVRDSSCQNEFILNFIVSRFPESSIIRIRFLQLILFRQL